MFRAARTRHAYRSDLRSFFAWAVTRDLLPTNPAAAVDPIKIPRSLPRPIGPEIAVALLVGSRRTRQMVGLGLYAGLRCAEIAALDVSDVADWDEPGTIVVRAGKGGRDRVIPLHPDLAELLSARPKSGPMFPNAAGVPIQAASASATIRKHLQRCGINATPHQLRHTFATEMTKRAHGDVFTVATVMGHSSVNDTMRYAGWSGAGAEIVALMFGGDAA
jgi:integrase/recombinase XerD